MGQEIKPPTGNLNWNMMSRWFIFNEDGFIALEITIKILILHFSVNIS